MMMMMNRTKSAVVDTLLKNCIRFNNNNNNKGGICISRTTITRSFCETGLADHPPNPSKKCVVVEDRIHMFLNNHNDQLCEPTTTIKALLCDKSDKTMNIATYNSLIDAHCVKGEIHKARSLVRSMHRHLSPDTATYTSLLNGYCNAYDNNYLVTDDDNVIDDAMMLVYHEMNEKGFKPDCVTYNRMIYRCFDSGLIEEARKLLDDLLAQGQTLDTSTYYDILQALSSRQDYVNALVLFEFLDEKDSNLNSDPSVIETILDCLASCGDFDYARELFEGLTARGVKPTPGTLLTMLYSLFEQGLINDAKLFLQMNENHYWPDSDTYNCLLRRYLEYKWYDDVKVLLCKMKTQQNCLDKYSFSMLRASIADGSLDATLSDLINELPRQKEMMYFP